ncbi:MAG: tellurite resistance/C4-dicarboxylate transporter family protein [Burkholderiales bacterium]|nr:tellurite resistance/C4-dicarboxylate transporter family protein [Burkholderiales bacterium]
MRLRFEHGARDRLRTLHPAYFAMVMATGIVAIAATLHGWAAFGTALFWLNVCFFVALAALTAARVVRHPAAFLEDLQSHSRGVGFFTVVAATAVLGSQAEIQVSAPAWAAGLWVVACMLWVLVTYGILGALTVKAHKPTLQEGLNGGWLVIVVAAQSVSILTVLVAASATAGELRSGLVFAALTLWLGGGMVYLWLTALIFFRYTFRPMAPDDLSPPYWINMGAVAISTLAGATLFEHLPLVPALADLAPFIKGFTIFYWAMGTWWIPMLLVLGVWRYLLREFPLSYDPLYWGGVFPLGMYCVSTLRLGETVQLPFLATLSRVFLYLAVAAWTATLAGLADTLIPRRPARAAAGQRDR